MAVVLYSRTPIFDAIKKVYGPITKQETVAIIDEGITLACTEPTLSPLIPPATPVTNEELKVVNMVDTALLKIAAPNNSTEELTSWVEPIKKAMIRWGITTPREIASFLANTSHESTGFTKLEENLNYSAERLRQVWPKRFPTLAIAQQYARNPEKLANFTYANRLGNGPASSGDGWKFRGYGLIMLTGRNNHAAFGRMMGIPTDDVPEYIRGSKEGAAMSAGWYWYDNDLDAVAATPGLADDRKAIQGGSLGLAEVTNIFNKLIAELLRRGA